MISRLTGFCERHFQTGRNSQKHFDRELSAEEAHIRKSNSVELPTMLLAVFVAIATIIVLPEAATRKIDRVLVPEKSGEVESCLKDCNVSELSVDCSRANCQTIPRELNSTIVTLIMTGGRLAFLSSKSFEHIPNLQYLDLGNCHIKELERKTFDGLAQLRYLNFSFNPLNHNFPEGIFSKLIRLRELYLSRTVKMNKFDNSCLFNLTELNKLSFGINQLTTFPKFLDSKNRSLLPNIVELNLENNNIERIKRAYMCGLESLERLNLKGNRIFAIWSRSLIDLKKLSHLELDRNFELCPQKFAFDSISLKYLSLADVHTFREGKCRKDIFNRLPNLTTLNIARSKILLRSLYAFFTVSRLQVLYMPATGLTNEMLPNIVKKFHDLRVLDVSENEISVLQGSTLQNLKLEVLLIRDNWLSVINLTTLPESTWTQLTRVDFSENTLYCDCQVVWFRRWLNSRKNTTVDNLKLTRCTGPAEVKDVPIHLLTKPTDLECFSEEPDTCLLSVFIMDVLIVVVASLVAFLYRLRWFLKYWYFRYKTQAKEFREILDHEHHYEFDAFISFSETNYEWVLSQLHPRLENEFGLSLCIHHRDWSLGRDIVENVVESIAHSRKTVLIVSNAFAVSQWCHFEMTMAQTKLFEDDRDNLILVLLEEIADCNMNPRLQLQMQRKTYIEWTDNEIGQQLFWEKLRRTLVKQSKSLINETPPRALFA